MKIIVVMVVTSVCYILVFDIVKIIVIMAVTSVVLHFSIWYNGDNCYSGSEFCCDTF